jgi:hypothetical protein
MPKTKKEVSNEAKKRSSRKTFPYSSKFKETALGGY